MMFAVPRLSLLREERGAAMIELAMVAPVIALMVVGVTDLSNAFGKKLAIEQAAQRSIEKVMNTTGADTVENTIKAEAAAQANVPQANVTVVFRMECNGAASSATSCSSGQTESRWILVTVTDRYTPLFPVHFRSLNGDGTYHLSTTAGVRVK